jgi:hypothetical protein
MYGIPMGAFESREMHLVMVVNFSKPIQCLFYLFNLIDFSFKRIARGHCPNLMTSGVSVTYKNLMKMKGWPMMRPHFS